MREVSVSNEVVAQIADLAQYLVEQLHLSKEATQTRIDRISRFLLSLAVEVDYPKCRFKRWRKLGYRCAVFEKDWVFAYEVFAQGVIVRDMSHAAMLTESESD